MRKIFIFLTICIVVNFSATCQTQLPIKYSHLELFDVTNNAEWGNFFPISDSIGIFNVGHAKLLLTDYKNGNVIKSFDDDNLVIEIQQLLNLKYSALFALYDEEGRKELPYCERQAFGYDRIYYLPKENLYACNVRAVVRQKVGSIGDLFMNFMLILNEELELVKIIEQKNYSGASLASEIGGFFDGIENYFVAKTHPELMEVDYFAHFKLENNAYYFQGYLQSVKSGKYNNFFPARHFSSFKYMDKYYINNGIELYETEDLECVSKISDVNMKLAENELITDLKLLENGKLIGLKIKLDEDGLVRVPAILFMTNMSFSYMDKMRIFNVVDNRLLSVELIGNKVVLLIFDEKKKQFIIETHSVE